MGGDPAHRGRGGAERELGEAATIHPATARREPRARREGQRLDRQVGAVLSHATAIEIVLGEHDLQRRPFDHHLARMPIQRASLR